MDQDYMLQMFRQTQFGPASLVTMNVFCMLSSYNKVNFKTWMYFLPDLLTHENGLYISLGVVTGVLGELIKYRSLNSALRERAELPLDTAHGRANNRTL